MNIIKGGLFAYECIRVVLLAFVLYLDGGDGLSVKAIFTASGALYTLMALFIWLDANRYRVYVPLFTAGKCIGIFILLIWLLMTRQVTMIECFVLSGDFFSLAAVFMINRGFQNTAQAAEDVHSESAGSLASDTVPVPEVEDK